MTVTSTPVNGRIRIVYPSDMAEIRVSAITPWAEANNIALFVDAIQGLQASNAIVEDIFFTVENLLEQE